ncbi:MAG: hypothetical protein AAB266_00960, partial [Nitrospirota bacterium]
YVVITRMASPRETPRYMALHILLGGIRGAIAPFLGPMILNDIGAETAFGVSIAFMVSALILVKLKGGDMRLKGV